ncbi:T9SS type A sorting domain-containing protein [Hymenobacter busanensis]|uniref:T9SS type A sorting domain-containing protein n=1 Tax=Hymenobacter busanensis TaxID=2607656 RepID=A0A7L4ZX66_9BACT|nr:T9SS-dependent M36 family metallopeptidase [Hymenobacter busanensis]KAA9333488.1 T9SS type A sorting domain-containing protein [Hymenobacter busanensis]QHJ07828.1 T9SS type A sorting domain-containing protein [Hymenobacter busanensis]
MTHTFTQFGRSLTLAALLALPTLGLGQTSTPLTKALEHLQAQRTKFGLSEADLLNPAVTSQYTDAHNGITHVYLRQRVLGIEVYNAVADVHLDRNGRVAGAHSSFVANANTAVRTAAPGLTAEQAVAATAQALNLPQPTGLQRQGEGSVTAGIRFNDGGISLEPIKAKLMYLPRPDGTLALTWDVEIYPKRADHYWSARVDAQTGALLDQYDYIVHEPASFAHIGKRMADALGATQVLTPATPQNPQRPNAPNSYNVFAMPLESPLHGAQTIVTDPANSVASPFGWHDTNGTAGAEYTITRGNNVYAYDDAAATNTPGSTVNGGATLEFTAPYVATATPLQNRPAAITNLFYWNNLMHDVMAVHGFTEVAGNFQTTNYSSTGLGNDEVQAEAQDGGGFDNANFGTPSDGQKPRMQMYRFQQASWNNTARPITLITPSTTAYNATDALGIFGPDLLTTGPINDTLVVVNDGSSRPAYGCGTLLNARAVRGNIALVRRSPRCSYGAQVLNAQNAGARAVIIADSVASNNLPTIFTTSTIGPQITIPVLGVTKATGDQLVQTSQTSTVTMRLLRTAQRDGDFDNGVISHEYGHGISNRLTGGPANSNCLRNAEQMGEGWSDFLGLWITTPPRSTGDTPRGVGQYVGFQALGSAGIRNLPYTTNFSINNYTYAIIGTGAYTEVHNIGEVWATVLWDLNWAFIGRYGYNTNLYASTGGNNMCLQLVLDGMKLQGCNPGFISGRNGILMADSINNGKANHDLIWQVFARRGMGYGASQGSSNSLTDQTISFQLHPTLAAKAKLTADMLAVFPNPAQDRVTVRMAAGSTTPVEVELLNTLGQVVQRTSASATVLQRDGVELNTADLTAGMYVVRLTGSTGTASHKLMVRH